MFRRLIPYKIDKESEGIIDGLVSVLEPVLGKGSQDNGNEHIRFQEFFDGQSEGS
jgi:hypothetical protein